MAGLDNRHVVCSICGFLVNIIDYNDGAGRYLPTLYFCGICKECMRVDDKRLMGKCVVCDKIFKDWKNHLRCENHVRWLA